jgi:hypothetical protein
MRRSIRLRSLLSVLMVATAGCSSPTEAPPVPEITSGADFAATVTRADYESAYGPNGYYEQFNLWVAIPPSTQPNAGVIVPMDIPVYRRRNGELERAVAADIRAGDRVEVWRDPVRVAYGAVQAPAGSPAYLGTQIVIVR